MLDSAAGRLYLWPRDGSPGDDIVAPALTELVCFTNRNERAPWTRNIHFDGLIFRHGDRMRWRTDRISLQHDWEQYDEPNAMVRLRGAGIALVGYGPGTRDENHHNEISSNHIHHVARLWWHSRRFSFLKAATTESQII